MPGIKRGNSNIFIDGEYNVKLKVTKGKAVIIESEPYDGEDESYQILWSDLEVDTAVGTSEAGDSAYIATAMFNLIGSALTKTKNYLAPIIGKLSIGGARATTYPLAAVVAEIGEDSENADAGFVSVIGGDSVAVNANAAFGIDHLNSNPGAGFDWIVDGHKEAHDTYNPGVPLKGFARLNVNSVNLPVGLYFGVAADDAGIVAQVGADATIGDGSLYISHADGAGKLFQKQNDVWVDIQA
jgi:hypothetical protein